MITRRTIDYTGMRHGTLTAVRFSHMKGTAYWVFICDCGKEVVARGCSVIGGHVKGCKSRCLQQAVKGKRNKELPEYTVWEAIKRRCYNPNAKEYKYYGVRGIKMCDAWKHSFHAFFSDMGERPSPKHSIDRINNDGNYEPSNCRWATATEQAINQRIRKTNKSGYKGVLELPNGRWRAAIRVIGKSISLGCYLTKQEAIDARIDAEKKYFHGILE